jgi:hypothetical protein
MGIVGDIYGFALFSSTLARCTVDTNLHSLRNPDPNSACFAKEEEEDEEFETCPQRNSHSRTHCPVLGEVYADNEIKPTLCDLTPDDGRF